MNYRFCAHAAERETTLAIILGDEAGNRDPWTGNTRPSSHDTAETDSRGAVRLYCSNSPNISRQTVRGSMEGRTARSRCAMPNSQHEPDGGDPPERAVQHGAVSANVFPTRRAGEATSSARVQPSDDARIDCCLSRATGLWTGARGERRNKTQLATPVRHQDATVFGYVEMTRTKQRPPPQKANKDQARQHDTSNIRET